MNANIPAVFGHGQGDMPTQPGGRSGDKCSPGVLVVCLHGLKCSFDNLRPMEALKLKIREQILQSGGWIGFDGFMQSALYFPGLGYYTGGRSDPFGEQGDFLTAPMLGPWLADALWNWSAPLRDHPIDPSGVATQDFRIREFGGGRGDLAAALLRRAQSDQAKAPQTRPLAIEMIELSAGLAQRQQQATQGLGRIEWAQHLANGFVGLVIANEVMDAMPVKCFEWVDGDCVLEWGVGLTDAVQTAADSSAAFGATGLVWASRPATDELAAEVLRRKSAAEQRGLGWPKGYRGEWNPWALPWLRALYESMEAGAVVLIDYGFAEPELDHPGRTDGSLCAHHRHTRIDSRDRLLMHAGQQDLTAHVNFSQISRAASQVGFQVNGFVTQARFLLNAGLLNTAQGLIDQAPNMIERTKRLQSLQMLMSESEMGEVFKVMLLSKNLSETVIAALIRNGFAEGDRLAE